MFQPCRNELVGLGLGGVTFEVRRIQLDVLTGMASFGKRVLTSGGLDIESDNFRSSLPLSVLRPRSILSSSPLTTTPDNSDLARPGVACTSRPSHDRGTVSLSHSSSSCDGTDGFEKVRRKILCGEVKYGDCVSDGGMGISTGLLGRRRELLRPKVDLNETGREGGVCDTGDGRGGDKDIMRQGWPVYVKGGED
jgi:hypothetical protein